MCRVGRKGPEMRPPYLSRCGADTDHSASAGTASESVPQTIRKAFLACYHCRVVVGHPVVNEVVGQPQTSRPWYLRRRLRLRWTLAAVGAAIVVVLLLAFVPISQESSFQISLGPGWEEGTVHVPYGTVLSISWVTLSGIATGLQVWQGGLLFNSSNASGAASVVVDGYGAVLISVSSVAAFGSEGVSQVHVSWRAALLWPLVKPD